MSQTSESRCAGMLRPNGHARHGKPFTMIFDDAFFLDYSEEAISEASRSKDIEDYNSALDRVEKERDQQSEEIDRLTAENVHLREERRKALSGYSDEIDRLKKEIADLSDMRDVLDTYRYNEEIRVAQVRDLTADLADANERIAQMKSHAISRDALLLIADQDLAKMKAGRDRLLKSMIHICEYWNGSRNERAMMDACIHIQEFALEEVIACKTGGQTDDIDNHTDKKD